MFNYPYNVYCHNQNLALLVLIGYKNKVKIGNIGKVKIVIGIIIIIIGKVKIGIRL